MNSPSGATLSPTATAERITSLDQFRGYSVAAMFIVNFVQHLDVAHQTLRHNNTHFSYADSIMPSFIFACGFAYRMSFAKLEAKASDSAARSRLHKRILIRSLGLILMCVMFFGLGGSFLKWNEMSARNVFRFIAELLKANMWEVLAIIGACQIFILPVIAARTKVRAATILLLTLVHVAISWSFNYDFVYGKPNWMDMYFGGSGKRAWDGGFFGIIAWSQIMLVGTIAHDLLQRRPVSVSNLAESSSLRLFRLPIAQLVGVGVLMMAFGYSQSCLTRLYDVAGCTDEQVQNLKRSPVLPKLGLLAERPLAGLLAEPPFVVPPPPQERIPNYWQMDKRVVTSSFVYFSSGLAMALYGVFVLGCDVGKLSVGLFRTFGQNPLAAYLIHHLVTHTVLAVVPKTHRFRGFSSGYRSPLERPTYLCGSSKNANCT